jgi:hypothetical protein
MEVFCFERVDNFFNTKYDILKCIGFKIWMY